MNPIRLSIFFQCFFLQRSKKSFYLLSKIWILQNLSNWILHLSSKSVLFCLHTMYISPIPIVLFIYQITFYFYFFCFNPFHSTHPLLPVSNTNYQLFSKTSSEAREKKDSRVKERGERQELSTLEICCILNVKRQKNKLTGIQVRESQNRKRWPRVLFQEN